jgi:hypothetical protein
MNDENGVKRDWFTKLKDYIQKKKLKYAVKWIKEVEGMHVVRIERRAGTNYMVAPDGQFWKIPK